MAAPERRGPALKGRPDAHSRTAATAIGTHYTAAVVADSRARVRSAEHVIGVVADGRRPADSPTMRAVGRVLDRAALDLARLERDLDLEAAS
jgi:hypothetical protein